MLNLCCTICDETIEPADVVHAISCGHIFHNHCLEQWLQRSNTCPQCRRQCTNSDTFRIYFNLENSNNTSIESLQMEIVNKTAMLENSEARIQDLEMQLSEKEVLINDYSMQIMNRSDTIDNNENKIQDLEMQMAIKDSLISKHTAEILNLQELLENNESRIQEFESEMAEKNLIISDHLGQIMNQTELLDNKENTIKKLINQLHENESLINTYLEQIEDKTNLLENKATRIEDLEIENNDKNSLIKTYRNQTEEKSKEINYLKKEVEIWKNINKHFQESVDSLIDRLNNETTFTKSDFLAASEEQDKERFGELRSFYEGNSI